MRIYVKYGMTINSPMAAQRTRTKRRTLITKSLQKKGAIPQNGRCKDPGQCALRTGSIPTLDDFHTGSIAPTAMANETTKVCPSDWFTAMLRTTDRRVHSEIPSHAQVS